MWPQQSCVSLVSKAGPWRSRSSSDHPCTWLKNARLHVEGVASIALPQAVRWVHVMRCDARNGADIQVHLHWIYLFSRDYVTVFPAQLRPSSLSRANLRYSSISALFTLIPIPSHFYLANPVSFSLLQDITLWEHCDTVILKQRNCKWDRADAFYLCE